MFITEQKHDWVRGDTNEYCKHCGHIFESDLGWTSADELACVERTFEIQYYGQIPSEIISYTNFRGLEWDKINKKFTKPFSNTEYTLDELNEILTQLKSII